MRAFAVDRGLGRKGVEVDRGDRIDGVDERNGIRSPFERCPRGSPDIGDVRGELHDHRHAGVRFAPARHHLDIFRHLTDGGAHASLAHAMRAAEIELHAVAARRLDLLQDVGPVLLLARHHQRNDERAVGPVALHLFDLAEVHVERPVGDELDVVEAEEPPVGSVDRAIARAVHVDDRRVLAERLPHDAAPAFLEGAHDIVFLVGRRRRGEPERVRRLDADEISAEVSHGECLSRWEAEYSVLQCIADKGTVDEHHTAIYDQPSA